MDNGWRTALLAIWVIAVVSAGLLIGVGFYLQGIATAADDIVRLARASVLINLGWGCVGVAGTFVTLWIVVSAIVLEHEKDRQERREQLG